MPKSTEIIKETPQKILLIKQRQLGDVLMGTLAIEALKEKFPHAQIDFLTEKKCKAIVKKNPYITNVFTIDKQEQSTIFKQIAFYRSIAKNNYDTVIALQTLPRVMLQVLFSKAKYKIGPQSKAYKDWLFTHTTKTELEYPAVDNVHILSPLGIIKPQIGKGAFFIDNEDKERAKQLLKEHNFPAKKRLITLDVTHKDFRRGYPVEHYTKLANHIQNNLEDVYFYIMSAPGEEEQVAAFIEKIEHKGRLILPKNCPPLEVSAALMSLADYHIGACSFPRHLAVSLDIPSTSLISISIENWDYPDERHLVHRIDLPCKPCEEPKKCFNPRCINELYPELIQDKTLQHIIEHTKTKSSDFYT